MPARPGKGGKKAMIKFLMGVIIGILIFFFFIYFGGGKTMKRVGEGLTIGRR
jgi:nucleoside recognition membrane protein YjiH